MNKGGWLLFKIMTRVVPDQKSKFETDELFRKLSRESEVFIAHFVLCKKFLLPLFLSIFGVIVFT